MTALPICLTYPLTQVFHLEFFITIFIPVSSFSLQLQHLVHTGYKSSFMTHTQLFMQPMLLAHSRICNPTFIPTYFLHFHWSSSSTAVNPSALQLPGFLSCSLAYGSIKNHLSSLHYFYELLSIRTDLHNDFYIHLTLRGLQRQIGNSPKANLPTTLQILRHLHSTIDFASSLDVAFWTACLVAFFTFFRKSNLLPASATSFDPDCNFTPSDVQIFSSFALITVNWTKTIQFQNKKLTVPIPRIPGSILCPVSMLQYYFHQVPHFSPGLIPLFLYQSGLQYHILTYPLFLHLLRQKLSTLGCKPSDYSGHSFRRGGASFAFSIRVPHELIKQQGDWNSDAYLRYLSKPLTQRL